MAVRGPCISVSPGTVSQFTRAGCKKAKDVVADTNEYQAIYGWNIKCGQRGRANKKGLCLKPFQYFAKYVLCRHFPVFCLLHHDARRRIQHSFRYYHVAPYRQAMHEFPVVGEGHFTFVYNPVGPETMARIAKLPNIVGLKEASGNLLQVQDALRLLPNGFEVYSGDDALNFPILALGGKAVISVVSNLAPQKVAALCRAVETGDFALARTLNFELVPLCKACFCEVNPIPVKAGLELLGYPVGAPRPPLTPLSKEKAALLFAAMQESKIL